MKSAENVNIAYLIEIMTSSVVGKKIVHTLGMRFFLTIGVGSSESVTEVSYHIRTEIIRLKEQRFILPHQRASLNV